MARRLRMQNFRGVREGEIELGRMTVLVGANNSAKSTVLEALFLLPNPLRRVPYSRTGSVPPEHQQQPHTAASLIHELHMTLSSAGYAFMMFRYTAREAVLELDDTELRFVRQGDNIHLCTNRLPPGASIQTIQTQPPMESFGWLSASGAGASPHGSEFTITGETLLISSELTRHAYWYMHNNWADIMNLGITKEVARDISEMTAEDFVNITIEPFLGGRLALFGFMEDGTRVRLGDMGLGVQVYAVARMLYELVKPEILMWDDVEAHMNPRMLVRVGEWLAELVEAGVDVVLTTHSLEAVRILSESFEDLRVCTTLLRDGLLEAKVLSRDEVEKLLSAGIDVRLADGVVI